MSAGQRRAKPKIKPPRKHGPDVPIDVMWAQLSGNIKEIQHHRAANLSFEENHRFAYNMVLHKEGDKLYNGVLKLIIEHLDELAEEKLIPTFPASGASDPMHQNQQGEVFLKALRHVWDDHQGSMEKLSQVLKYMDRVHAQAAGVHVISEAGLILFQQRIIREPIQGHIISVVLGQIRIERDGYDINRSAVKECVDVTLNLVSNPTTGQTVYQRDIEPAFLAESDRFYKLEGEAYCVSSNAADYLKRVEGRLAAEESRALHYLHSQTTSPLRQILLQHLLQDHLEEIVGKEHSGLDSMIDSDKFDDMSRLYRLFTMVQDKGRACIKNFMKQSVVRRGKLINQASLGTEDDQSAQNDKDVDPTGKLRKETKTRTSGTILLETAMKWVEEILELKQRFDRVWKESLESDRDIESGLNEAFATVINSNNRSPEFISLFIDDHLKKGLKGKTDAEVDLILDRTIAIFRYLSEKDVFDRYYQGHLAKRLLQGRSVSNDAERGMLAKLKVEAGFQFTQKLESMFHDMKISEDTMKSYKEHLEKSTHPPALEISVTVMTANCWPVSYNGATCTLPPQLTKACRSFEQFYLSRHSGRRLTWQPSQGTADIVVQFKARKHTLTVSTFSMVILLLFEDIPDDEELTYEDIKAATSIANPELKRHLQSLACGKCKVLKKHPPGRDIDTDDCFSFNSDFKSNMQKIKIGTIASKVESTGEQKETREFIDEVRRHQTQAYIVRIMKNRKHLTHVELVNEVTRQLSARFQPNPQDIKKQIEEMIEKEYLERCEDRKSYNYLA